MTTGPDDTPPPRLWIACPTYGGMMYNASVTSLLKFQKVAFKRKLDIHIDVVTGDSLITRFRNYMVSRFLEHPAFSHFLFLDVDIGFAPETIFNLMDANKDVIGGVYPIKEVFWDRLADRPPSTPAEMESAATRFVVKRGPYADEPMVNGVGRAEYVGTGFMMIRRPVFDRLKAAYPDLRYGAQHVGGAATGDNLYAFFDSGIDRETGTYLSEDYMFCKRWRAIGGDVWIYGAAEFRHVGPRVFRGTYSGA